MSQVRKNAKEVFLAALDVAPGGQATFLDEVCAGDKALRQEVEALLDAHNQPDSLLDNPRIHLGFPEEVASPTRSLHQPGTETPGTVIGPYQLLEQIGEGSFGVVFMAEQTQPIRRKVALRKKPRRSTQVFC